MLGVTTIQPHLSLEHPESLAEQYDAQINAHHAEIRRLREMRNANCSSTRKLPPEILSIIFGILSRQSYFIQLQPLPSHISWIVVTHVCRSWRKVALDEPRLWTDLSEVPIKWAKEMLKRSKAARLCVKYHISRPKAFECIYNTVLDSPDRLRSLDIVGYDNQFISRLTKPMPFLESLHISGDIPIPLQFLGGYAPRLRAFTSWGGFIPLGTAWMSNLRKLCLNGQWKTIDDTSGSVVRMNVNVFLAALQKLPHLEVLSANFPEGMDSSLPPDSDVMIHLPCLKIVDFSFSESDLPLADIFNHITTARIQRLQIDWPYRLHDWKPAKAACKFFEKTAGVLPQMLRWNSRSLELCEITPDSSGDNAQTRLSFSNFEPLDVQQLLDSALPNCEFRILQARAYEQAPLQQSDSIEEIHILTVAALRAILCVQPTDQIPLPYPSLRRLHIKDVSFTPKAQIVPEFKRWLSGRKKLAKLECLVIKRCGLNYKDIVSLEKSVPIIWDGVVPGG